MRKQLCMMALAATMLAMPAWAQQAVEQQVMDLANADRAQQGLSPLKWDPALAQAAADHAQLMAQQPALSHQYPGEADLVTRCGAAGAHFRSIAENVALAPSPQALEKEWMNSAPHRANILNPAMNTIGVGLVKEGRELLCGGRLRGRSSPARTGTDRAKDRAITAAARAAICRHRPRTPARPAKCNTAPPAVPRPASSCAGREPI